MVDATDGPRYARLWKRLRAVLVDNVIWIAVVFLAIAVASKSDDVVLSKAAGVFAVLFLCLYEPVLVSRFGGTIGHRACNLRIVDDSSGGNISFVRAFIRFAVKLVLGTFSFLTMIFTQRHQSLHDLASRSTVQLRDASRASPNDYLEARVEQPALGPGG